MLQAREVVLVFGRVKMPFERRRGEGVWEPEKGRQGDWNRLEGL